MSNVAAIRMRQSVCIRQSEGLFAAGKRTNFEAVALQKNITIKKNCT
jgi:hypothetical protein